MRHFLTPMLEAAGPVGLQVERTGQSIVAQLEGAFDSTSRRRGLLGRDGLADGTGLVIAPSQGVHTFGMRFPLDIVGLAPDGRVVKVKEGVSPNRIVIALTAFAILELPAGMVRRVSLVRGDRVIVQLPEACEGGSTATEPDRPRTHPTVAPGADRSQDAG